MQKSCGVWSCCACWWEIDFYKNTCVIGETREEDKKRKEGQEGKEKFRKGFCGENSVAF